MSLAQNVWVVKFVIIGPSLWDMNTLINDEFYTCIFPRSDNCVFSNFLCRDYCFDWVSGKRANTLNRHMFCCKNSLSMMSATDKMKNGPVIHFQSQACRPTSIFWKALPHPVIVLNQNCKDLNSLNLIQGLR